MSRADHPPDTRRARKWIALALCLQAASCYSYTGSLRVVPGSLPTPSDRSPDTSYTDSDLEAAREIVREVAALFEMRDDPDIQEVAEEMNERLGRSYELLAYFTRHDESAPSPAERARINIGADARDDRSELVFWIRDLDHGGETEFTRKIKAALESRVRKRFDASHIRYEILRISTFMSG